MNSAAPRIALIHATPLAIGPIEAAFSQLWPEAHRSNLLDDSLSVDLALRGELDGAMMDRFAQLADYVVGCGADAILFTCSAFGPAIEAVAAAHSEIPVLKPNEAMFEAALAGGRRIGLVATFAPSLPSMATEFAALLAEAGRTDVTLETVCAAGAMDALAAGDSARHNSMIGEAATRLPRVDTIMLAQFSMAEAKELTSAAAGCTVLTSPESAVRKLKSLL